VRILFLSPRQCWPPQSGAKLREYHFARALARRGELTYVYFMDPGATPLTVKDLPFCRDVVAIPKPAAYAPWKLLQGLLGRTPLPVLNYASAEMAAAVQRLLSTGDYDLLHLDSIHMVPYVDLAKKSGAPAKVVLNWHNIESEAMLRYRAIAPSSARRWYATQTAHKLESLESLSTPTFCHGIPRAEMYQSVSTASARRHRHDRALLRSTCRSKWTTAVRGRIG